MPRRLHLRVFLLAAVLLVGAVAVPVVHRVQHAVHAAEVRTQLHGEAGHVHADHAAFSGALPVFVDHDVVCVLCTTWSTWALVRSGVFTPARHVLGLVADVVVAPRSGERYVHPIRGPPALF